MLSHPQRAKAFRQWVLDVREQQAWASANMAESAAPFPPSVLLFNGKPVRISTRLAECFGVDRSILRGNQALMPDKFMTGEHYVTPDGQRLAGLSANKGGEWRGVTAQWPGIDDLGAGGGGGVLAGRVEGERAALFTGQ